MNSTAPYYRQQLTDELRKRVARNANYSVRSFARALQLAPGSLSQIIGGKRSISKKVADRILGHLELSAAEREQFILSIVKEKQHLGIRKIHGSLTAAADSTVAADPSEAERKQLESAHFALLSEWYHYAILEMTFKKDFKLEARWIAARLGISIVEATLAAQNVLKLGLIEKKNGRWRKIDAKLDTKDKSKSTPFHRRRSRQILEKSILAIENEPIENRNYAATTLCVDPSRIPEAKKRVQKFIWELTEFLEGEDPRHVYELAIQFFPLEKIDAK